MKLSKKQQALAKVIEALPKGKDSIIQKNAPEQLRILAHLLRSHKELTPEYLEYSANQLEKFLKSR